jgi:hypothetical protein
LASELLWLVCHRGVCSDVMWAKGADWENYKRSLMQLQCCGP